MKLYFKPMPWLTVIVVICLAILISLGTWQYQRLQWKTALLAEVEVAATAPPFSSIRQIQSSLDQGEPVDFRRIEISLKQHPTTSSFLVFHPQDGDIFWKPFLTNSSDGVQFFTTSNKATISDADRDKPWTFFGGDFDVVGYVRLARKTGRFTVKSSPKDNRWFGFNPMPENHNWGDKVEGDVDMRFYLETVPGATDASLLPPKRPDIRNNHLDYMLTWYSFALILLIIYFILHRRAGRLRFS